MLITEYWVSNTDLKTDFIVGQASVNTEGTEAYSEVCFNTFMYSLGIKECMENFNI